MSHPGTKVVMVVPCFNEYKRFNLEYWGNILELLPQIEWHFVDDGSTDKTVELLESLHKYSNVQVIRNDRNRGKAEAIRQGMNAVLHENSKIDFMGYVDSDGAFSATDIEKLINIALNERLKPERRDVWISSRVGLAGRAISRKTSRHYLGRLVATFITLGWRGAPYDTQSGFKIFMNSPQFQDSLKMKFRTRWFFDIEMLNRIAIRKSASLNIWEEPLSSWVDVSGSHIKASQYFQIIRDLLIARQGVRKVIQGENGENKWI